MQSFIDDIMKTAPSRTMSSIMNSIKQNERSESSSDLDSESSSSDESKGKDELFKSLKFSDDILQQMNAKRQEIVGGRRIQATGTQAQTNLNLRKDSAKKEVERVHIEIGAPLGRQLLVPKSSQENNKPQQENNTDVLRSNNDDIKIEKPNVLNKSDKSKLDENLCSHLDLKNKEDSKEAYVASHIDKKAESVTGEKDVSEKEEKVEARTSIKQTYLDEINSFKASLEKDMLKEKASLMKKFNAEISEEMRKLEDERFEKLKTYEIEMTKKLHKELEEFKDSVKKELEEKKKEIISNQESVLSELAQNANAMPKSQNLKQSNQCNNLSVHDTKPETTDPTKQAKNSNAKIKVVPISNNIFPSENNPPSPFSKQLEDLEKDIRRLRTQMVASVGGSVSDYSSFSDGADVEQNQINQNHYGDRNMSPDIESIATYTDDDELNAERCRTKYTHRDKCANTNMASWNQHGSHNDHRLPPHFAEENMETVSQQDYKYIDRGKLKHSHIFFFSYFAII